MVLVVLHRLGMVSIAKLKEIRRYVIVGAFVVAAVITPPDVVSQLLLAIPLCLLYELGIILCRFFPPPAGRRAGRRRRVGLSRRPPRPRRRQRSTGGRLPTVTSTSVAAPSRQTFTLVDEPGGNLGDAREQRRRVARRLAVDLEHDVARLDAGAVGRTIAHDAADQRRRGTSSASACAISGVRSCGSMPNQPRVTSPSRMICSSTLRASDTGIAKPMPSEPPGLREDRAVDADQVAGGVDERAAGVARVDRGVGLDEVLEAVDAEMVAAERRHDAHRHRVAEAEGVADRQHDVADLHASRACRR